MVILSEMEVNGPRGLGGQSHGDWENGLWQEWRSADMAETDLITDRRLRIEIMSFTILLYSLAHNVEMIKELVPASRQLPSPREKHAWACYVLKHRLRQHRQGIELRSQDIPQGEAVLAFWAMPESTGPGDWYALSRDQPDDADDEG